jgi:hypothetical protein
MACVIIHDMIIEEEKYYELKPIITQPNHVPWRREPMRRALNF